MPDRSLPHHVTMPLLDRVVEQAVDEEYADAAARRGAPADAAHTTRSPKVAVTLAVIGVLGGAAFVLNAQDSDVDETSRAVLINRVETERTELGERQDTLGALQAEIGRIQQASTTLADDLRTAEDRGERLGLMAGYAGAQGPGVRITVEDSPSGLNQERVRDEDLALLVDGLWGAGAEAIAINGKRLTVLSAIRNSSQAINVNSRPLSPPYVVEAIGDENTLQARLLASTRGNEFFGLAEQLGFVYRLENVDNVVLPAARARKLRFAVARLSAPDADAREGNSQ